MGQTNRAVSDTGSCELPPGLGRPRTGRRGVVDAGLARLAHTLETEIVPRLLVARRGAGDAVPQGPATLDPGDANELARLLVHHDVEIPFAYVEAVRQRGVPLSQVYLGLLAPAARRLGVLWERDECDFMQVTLGLGRLHQLLQRFGHAVPEASPAATRGHGRRALLVTVPGEDHTFGMLMVSQHLRQEGWEVWNEFPDTLDEMYALVAAQPYALVGLSCSSTEQAESLGPIIRQLRRVSSHRSVGVMVGGVPFMQSPELATRVGADATASDGHEAARRAESVCALIAGER